MIERREQVTEKAIIVGLILSLLVWTLSIKANPVNTAHGIQIGNIGLPTGAVETLRKILGH
jgi:hypothetical protein